MSIPMDNLVPFVQLTPFVGAAKLASLVHVTAVTNGMDNDCPFGPKNLENDLV